MFRLHFKNLSKFIKYRNNFYQEKIQNKIKNVVDEDLQFREDAEYDNLKERLIRHNILERIDGLKELPLETALVKRINDPAKYLEETMNIHLKANNNH